MSEANVSRLPRWIADHLQRYLETDGTNGHMWDSTPVGGPGLLPTLLLTTRGRHSGKPITMPLIYGEANGNYIVVGTTETVTLHSDPPGATASLSSGGSCTTPCQKEVKKKNDIQVTFTKEGCRKQTQTMVSTIGTSGVVSPVLFGVFGLIDYGTGSVYKHKPNPLMVDLDCKENE